MTQIRFIGDVHGKFHDYWRVIQSAEHSIQVGDFGVGFPTDLVDPVYEGDHFFLRGNHDNPQACKEHPKWIKDGTFHNGVWCMGGALSIDKAWRTEGVDWWEDEELSVIQLGEMIDRYEAAKPDIVATHEAPESVVPKMFTWYNKLVYPSRTRQALQRMYELHQPKLWIFGHWHFSVSYGEGNTNFVCLNELQYMDVEV